MFLQQSSVVDPSLWAYFIGGVLCLITIDLAIFHRKSHDIHFKEALLGTAFWVSIALGFNFWFYTEHGADLGMQFLTGYLVEQSLSVDNLFVILLVFQSLKIPRKFQHRVLFWGILGAIVFRGILIVLGTSLINRFHWIMYIFGGILIFTAARLLFHSDAKDEVNDNFAVRLVHKFLPVSEDLDGQKFFTRKGAKLFVTPLFVALIVVEISDIVFAVDSIPAVFAVTRDSFVAFGSNILAILGLRTMYFVIAEMVSRLRYLKPGLAAILGFVGIKMLISEFYHIPSAISLAVLGGILSTAALTSIYVKPKDLK